jgi:hypothetical protein
MTTAALSCLGVRVARNHDYYRGPYGTVLHVTNRRRVPTSRAATARSTDSPVLSQRYFEITRPVRVSRLRNPWTACGVTPECCAIQDVPRPSAYQPARRHTPTLPRVSKRGGRLLHVGVREGCSVPPAGVSAGSAEREPSIE